MSSLLVISDASPLISLARIGLLRYLSNLFGKIYVPNAVYKEVTFDGKGRSGADEVTFADWIIVHEVTDQSKVTYLRGQLDIGEAEAIVLAQEIEADLILIDERKARAVAERLGLDAIGTLGILVILKNRGMITEVRPLLDQLRSFNFRLSDQLYNEILSQADEG